MNYAVKFLTLMKLWKCGGRYGIMGLINESLMWRVIMTDLIMQVAIGLVIIVVGVLNAKGHISLLHSYHRKRVKEEDVLPFGKTIGFGTIIVGFTVIVAGISELFFSGITNIILVFGFVPGFIVIVYALLKYNKGIFR